MDKIEVGEFVRTVDGKFGIFDRYSERKEDSLYKSPFNCFIKLQKRKTCLQCSRDYIIKHSKNIIDLIEEGDYVNGHLIVNEIYGEDDNELYFEIEDDLNKSRYIGEKDIEYISTKEKYKEKIYVINREE